MGWLAQRVDRATWVFGGGRLMVKGGVRQASAAPVLDPMRAGLLVWDDEDGGLVADHEYGGWCLRLARRGTPYPWATFIGWRGALVPHTREQRRRARQVARGLHQPRQYDEAGTAPHSLRTRR